MNEGIWVVEVDGVPVRMRKDTPEPKPLVGVCVVRDVLYVRASTAEPLERWAVRVLWGACEKDWHISQPYPHKRLGGWELIATPPNARDQYHHGDTAALCVIAAARALCAEDQTLPKEPGT